jgi:hypothetical protein
MAQELNSNERWWFKNRAAQADRQFRYGKAQNDYERGLAKTQATWDRSDLIRQFTNQRNSLAGGFQRRGVMNSGLYQRGYKDWSENKVRSLTRQTSAADARQRGFDIAAYSLADIRQKTLDDLQAQKLAYEQSLSEFVKANQV